jgi:hypothetical protein
MERTGLGEDGLLKALAEDLEAYKAACASLKHFTVSEPVIKVLPRIGYKLDFYVGIKGFVKDVPTPSDQINL